MADSSLNINIRANVAGQTGVEKLASAVDALGEHASETAAQTASGARGIADLGAKANAATPGVQRLDEALRAAGDASERGQAKLAATRRGLQSISDQLEQTQRGLASLRDSLIAGFSSQQFVQAAAQMEQVQAGLQAVTGSAQAAGEQMEFVRRMASAAGVDVAAAGQAFLGLAAATRGTAVEGEPARRVFEAVTLAMAKAGKSSAETQNALLALSQIASKGTVSMEELRGQLGEALPGALQAAANGLGITTKDLIQLTESGQLAAEDLFPALAKGLNDLYGGAPRAQTLSQEITNIKNAFVEMAASIGEAGALDALKTGAEVAQTAITLLGDTLVTTGKTIGTLSAAVATLDFSGLSEAFRQIEDESRARLLKAAEHNQVLAGALRISSDAATQAALAQQQAGAAAQQAGADAGSAGGQWVKLASDYGKVKTAMAEQADAAEKALLARQAEGKAAVEMARALGSEGEQRAASAAAAQAEADASAEVARLKVAELEVRRAELQSLQKLADADGALTEQRKKQLEDLQKDIDLRQEVADKAVAQARSARIAAEAAAVEAEAQRDNSARVKELAAAYDEARKKAEELHASKKASAAEMEAADIAASRAAALYRDALADVTKNLQARQTIEQATLTATTAAMNAEKARYQAMIDAARADGDYATALYATIEQKKLDIEITRAKVAGMRAEAEGAIAVAKAKLAELEASQKIDPVKRAQIEASIKIAEAKKLEADAVGRSVDGIERQIQALRDGRAQVDGFGRASQGAADAQQRLGDVAEATGDRASAAALKAASALDAQNAAQERLNSATEKAAELERKRLGIDNNGFSTDKDGKRLVAGGDLTTLTGIFNFLKSVGVTDEAEARRLALEFSDGKGNIPYLQNPGQMRYGGDTLSMALLRAAEQFTFRERPAQTQQAAQPVAQPQPSAYTTQPAQVERRVESVHTVRVEGLGNRAPAEIGVRSEADARAVIDALRSAAMASRG